MAPRLPLAALAAVTLWGASFSAVAAALESFRPVGLVALRLALGGLALVAVQRVRGERFLPRRRTLGRCLVLGAVLGVHLSIQATGQLYTSAVHTGWIIGFAPVTTALGAQLFLRKRLRGIGWFGVALGTLGVCVVTLEDPAGLADAGFGDALQLVSCVTWTAYTLLGVRAVEEEGAARVAGVSMLVASALLLPVGLVRGLWHAPPTPVAWGAVAYLGLFCNALAFSLWYRAQRVHGVHRTGATLYLEPFVALVAAMLLLGEPFGPRAALGGVVMLVGVWFVGRGAPR